METQKQKHLQAIVSRKGSMTSQPGMYVDLRTKDLQMQCMHYLQVRHNRQVRVNQVEADHWKLDRVGCGHRTALLSNVAPNKLKPQARLLSNSAT